MTPLRTPRFTHHSPLLLAALCQLASLCHAPDAQAEPFTSGGGGLFVGWDFGGESVTWGGELFASFDPQYTQCSSDPRTVYGPLTRFSLHGISQPELLLTGYGVSELDRMGLAGSLELGVGLGFPGGIEEDAQWTPHTGFGVELTVLHAYARQEWLLGGFTLGGGARFLPLSGPLRSCVAGRPQRDASGQAQVHGSSQVDSLAAEFCRSAQHEYESVMAFFQLATELSAAGAPRELLSRALLAAQQEVVHTAQCTRLARRYGAKAFVPRVPKFVGRPPLAGGAGIARLATESWLDGCLGEGLAAVLAQDHAARSTDPEVQRVQAQIATDEQSHAELAWDVLAWCHRAEPAVRPLLQSMRGVSLRPPPSALGYPAHRQGLAARQSRRARERLAAL